MGTATKQNGPEKPTSDKSVGVAEVAEHLGTDPRTLRVFLRRSGKSVGRGTSYSWQSLDDPSLQKLRADWDATKVTSDRPSTKK